MEYICDLGISNDGMIVRRSHVREEIVRCRNCEYLVDDDSRFHCYNLGIDIDFNTGEKPNGFCAWGEKKLITEETVELFKTIGNEDD